MYGVTIEVKKYFDELMAELEKTYGHVIELGRQLSESESEVKRLKEEQLKEVK